jgi:phosphoglycerol transferase MdoB-like AlkP superfamily enzyme
LFYTPLLVLITGLLISPATVVAAFEQLASEIVKYSDAKSVANNGRLSMMLYREAQRQDALNTILPYQDRKAYHSQLKLRLEKIKPHLNKHNVHLIVLESFLDPRLFEKLSFSKRPVHPDFEALFKDKLGLSKSPVFGGATAQAEFEILCGVPAFEKLSSVEFNMFTGSPAYCLPGMLAEVSYRTVASNAYKPNFFNAIAGYDGAGFTEQYFPVEFYSATASYLKTGDPGKEEYLFDGKLFEQNLAFVKKHLARNPAQPLLNYMMTIYGHTPHLLDPAVRPEVLSTISTYPDDLLQRASNQFYYRTQAIAHYVKELMRIDPNSLIILVADHVPPLRNGPNTYSALQYLPDHQDAMYYNRLAVIADKQVRRYHDIHHYELPDIIFDYLSDGQYCEKNPCAHLGQSTSTREQRLDAYLRLMAHAAE